MNLEVKREPLALESPQTPEMRDYKIYVITEDNQEEVFKRMEENNLDPILFGLSDEGYEDKSLNDKETVNYIIELRRILQEYRDYYESDR